MKALDLCDWLAQTAAIAASIARMRDSVRRAKTSFHVALIAKQTTSGPE